MYYKPPSPPMENKTFGFNFIFLCYLLLFQFSIPAYPFDRHPFVPIILYFGFVLSFLGQY